MDIATRDLRFALRRLARRPLVVAVMILTLGLGFGVNAAFVSAYRSMVLDPLPFRQPEQLVEVTETEPMLGRFSGSVSPANLLDWRAAGRGFAGLEAFTRASFNLHREAVADRVSGARVTPGLFELLGVEPALGRWFSAEEGIPGGRRVAIVSDDLWRRQLSADPAVLGSAIEIDGEEYEVVGIMAPPFAFPLNEELWVPLTIDPAGGRRDQRTLRAIGRIEAPSTIEQARASMDGVGARLAELYPETNRGRGVAVTLLHDALMPPVTAVAALAMVILAGLVLLIVGINVVNMLLSETLSRGHETALRVALGASRGRLLREGVSEGLLISLPAAVLGIVLATAYQEMLHRISVIQVPYWLELKAEPFGTVHLYVLLLAMVTGVAIGWLGSRPRGGAELIAGAAAVDRVGRSPGARRLRRVLVVAEYAMAVVVLTGALLMVSSFRHLTQGNPGFAVSDVLTLRIGLAGSTAEDGEQGLPLVDRLLDRLESLPEVRGAAVASLLPVSRRGYRVVRLEAEGSDLEEKEMPVATLQAVSPSYFPVLGIDRIEGRLFASSDPGAGHPVVLISQALANRLWNDQPVTGRRLRLPNDEVGWRTVVGVVADIEPGQPLAGIDRQPKGQLYIPLGIGAVEAWALLDRAPTLLIRSSLSTDRLAAAVRRELKLVDETIPAFDVLPMSRVLTEFYFAQHIWSRMFALMAAVALLIAAVGAYGISAYSVNSRVREVGIRMALGAPRRRVLVEVLGEAVGLAGLGLLLGMLVAIPASHAMSALVHGVGFGDPGVAPLIVVLLFAIGLAAGFGPARRAASVDPMTALRGD